jgi:hypothetical protein
MHLAAYDWQNSEHRVVDGAWAVDIDRMPTTGAPDTRAPGDVVVYIGRAEGSRDVYVWPPALVVQSSRAVDGEQRLVTLTNDTSVPVRRRELPPPLRARLAKPVGVLSPIIARKVLALWRLDALCEECGWIGAPITYGLTPDPSTYRFPKDPLDPAGAAVPSGCPVQPEGSSWQCPRCARQWPYADPVIKSLWDLLDLKRCGFTGELEQVVRDQVELDDMDMVMADDNDNGADLGFALHGAYRSISYPFYMSEFWHEAYQVCADAGLPRDHLRPPLYV